MNWMTRGVTVAVAMAGGLAVRRVLLGRRSGGWPPPVPTAAGRRSPRAGERRARWHSITVNRPVDEVVPGGVLPAPLRELGEAVEVRVLPAAGDKGTELHVRLRAGEPSGLGAVAARLTDRDPRFAVRRALREAKQIVETGEVLEPSDLGTAKRTLLNRPLEYATRHGREGGLL